MYYYSNKNTKKTEAINQLINIPLIKAIDSINGLSFTSHHIYYDYWLL